jgi:excisionase family DNA binding protein
MTTKHLPQETPPQMFNETFLEVLTEKVAERLIPRLAQIAERTDSNETRYLSLEQAAEFIGTSYEGMRAMARKEHIPVVRRGARRHIDKRDLVAFMEKNKAS